MCASNKSNLESIEDFILNQDKIVTYRWLSKKLKVHANTAKQLLYTFSVKNAEENLAVTYLIGGQTQDGEIKISVVNQSSVDKVKSSLKTVLCEHVYSVQKASSSVSSAELYLADSLSQDEDNNEFCSITSRKLEQREFRNTIPEKPAACLSKPLQASSKTQQKEQVKPSLFNSKANATQKKKENENKETKETETQISKPSEKNVSSKSSTESKIVLSPTKNAKKSGFGKIGTLFGKQNALNAEKKKNELPPKKTEDLEEAATLSNENELEKEDEESFDEKSIGQAEKTVLKTPVTKSKKKKSAKSRSNKKRKNVEDDDAPAKRRKRIVIASDSDSDECDEEEMDIEEEPQPEPDSFVQAEVPDSDEEVIPPTPFEDKVRRKIRKLRDRTYTDDEGFIVTKKEYVFESCSDDEKESSVTNKDDSETPKKSQSRRQSKDKENENEAQLTNDKNIQSKSNTEESAKIEESKTTEPKPKPSKGKNEKKPGKGKSSSPKKTASKGNSNQKSITSFFKKM